MFLVVNHSDRSVPSSSMLFALYIRALYLSFSLSTMNLQPEHYYSLYQIGILSTWCDCQPPSLFPSPHCSIGKYPLPHVEFLCHLFKFFIPIVYVDQSES